MPSTRNKNKYGNVNAQKERDAKNLIKAQEQQKGIEFTAALKKYNGNPSRTPSPTNSNCSSYVEVNGPTNDGEFDMMNTMATFASKPTSSAVNTGFFSAKPAKPAATQGWGSYLASFVPGLGGK
ncbi:MAG: hypothetical protein NTZ67_06610 [Gammaproteobacteria bacterium]|nr:hypothetical protein [Gammaproteobacteria bacterium]